VREDPCDFRPRSAPARAAFMMRMGKLINPCADRPPGRRSSCHPRRQERVHAHRIAGALQ